MGSSAIFSDCREYRYLLTRKWVDDMPLFRGEYAEMLMIIGLNPSTADEAKNDPTVTRCIRFAQDLGFGGLYMLNLFAFRATDPQKMFAAADPVADNDRYLNAYAARPDVSLVLCAWGNHGLHLGRSKLVVGELKQIRDLHCFGLNKTGEPKHPLYLRADCKPVLFTTKEGL